MPKDAILRSSETTDPNDVPHPADYDEELAPAHLVEAGLGSDVPSTDLDEVEREGMQPIAKTTGNVLPDPIGGEGDYDAARGATPSGDPELNPDEDLDETQFVDDEEE